MSDALRRVNTVIRVAVTMLVAATGCACLGPGTTDALVISTAYTSTDSLPSRPVGSAASFGAIIPCTKAGPITVTDIVATDPHNGFTIATWGSRPNPMAIQKGSTSAAFETLVTLGFTREKAEVANRCPLEREYPASLELGVQAQWSGPATAWTKGITVRYRDEDGSTGEITLPRMYVLCGQGDPPEPATC